MVSGGHFFFGEHPGDVAERLDQLAADLRQLGSGQVPGSSQMAGSPYLCSWSAIKRSHLCLHGKMFGHPTIRDGTVAVTSPVFAIDANRRWVRTLSRFYELGPAAVHGLQH